MLSEKDVLYSPERCAKIADEINAKTIQVIKAGVGAGLTVDLGVTPTAIVSVLAVTTATGAPATKYLLAPTTDYTFSGNLLTCVTDQSANTLIVTIKA